MPVLTDEKRINWVGRQERAFSFKYFRDNTRKLSLQKVSIRFLPVSWDVCKKTMRKFWLNQESLFITLEIIEKPRHNRDTIISIK